MHADPLARRAAETGSELAPAPYVESSASVADAGALAGVHVVRRSGALVSFQADKISLALSKAFLAAQGEANAASSRMRSLVAQLTATVALALARRLPAGGVVHIEDIQDQVELALMRSGEHDVARAYVLYREKRAAERLQLAQTRDASHSAPTLHVIEPSGQRVPLDMARLRARCEAACVGLGECVDADRVLGDALKNLYDGIAQSDVDQALTLAARALIERDPAYSQLSARLLLTSLASEVRGRTTELTELPGCYAHELEAAITRGIAAQLLDARLADFDLAQLGAALNAKRDEQFDYLGLQTLYDRYFLHIDGRRSELPQVFFMRVAMGLALNEIERERRAIEFYELLSRFDFMCSTPTLFNSGTRHSQLSSCYLTSVQDDLEDIYQGIKENALLQKFAGGLGNDWTPIRALGSRIKGTNGQSQGVIPFLKVVNDTALAVNQGGKRKGAVCAYLETWHLDIEEFLELRKNTGDERRRCHDMNTAHWIPDLFMQRVQAGANWTLFSPNEVPDLHEKVGAEFVSAYVMYEAQAAAGRLRQHKTLPAVQLWRRMLTMLFETGHPWITFKDVCNLRSPQSHVGVVHSSNLCTEITLNTSNEETAVCNLGSINLTTHLKDGALDPLKLRATAQTALRMLDNVIELNYYATPKARNANLRHRPVGLGIMGFSDCLHALGLAYASEAAVEFADRSMELVCFEAYRASTDLARERGRYSSFAGSLWDHGVLPIDSIERVAAAREMGELELDRSTTLDWDELRTRIAHHGMRNSNCVAIAPTATISNIVGVSAGIEPPYQNIYVKSNLSGEFTVVNTALVRELKASGLWDEVMVADLKYFDGSLAQIERVPSDIKARYATAFEIAPVWLIDAAARRQKWIDQAQSLNLYLATPSGKALDEMYRHAWRRGLKTTYYLRTLGASHTEKSEARVDVASDSDARLCSIDNPDCEACQ
jgi:ribonucleoside-diphosphate reductase alpha chain